MSSSRLATAEDALLAILVADATLNAVQGGPELGEPQGPAREHVWIAEQAEVEQVTHLTGASAQERREEYTLRVVVFVSKLGDRYQATRDRAATLSAKVEDVVRAAPNLGLAQSVIWRAEVIRIERASMATDKIRGIAHIVHVRCVSYI